MFVIQNLASLFKWNDKKKSEWMPFHFHLKENYCIFAAYSIYAQYR